MRAATTLLRRATPRWARSVFIQVEKTPNPFSLKFLPSQPVKLGAETTSGFHFTKGDPESNKSPLARKLFTVDHVTGVFIQQDFVTVSKVLAQRPAVLRRLHAIDATRVHLLMKWVVSFSISRPFGPSQDRGVVVMIT